MSSTTLTVLSVIAGKKVETQEDYLVAGRKLSLFLCWGTMIATWFGAEAMTAASENARREGFSAHGALISSLHVPSGMKIALATPLPAEASAHAALRQ